MRGKRGGRRRLGVFFERVPRAYEVGEGLGHILVDNVAEAFEPFCEGIGPALIVAVPGFDVLDLGLGVGDGFSGFENGGLSHLDYVLKVGEAGAHEVLLGLGEGLRPAGDLAPPVDAPVVLEPAPGAAHVVAHFVEGPPRLRDKLDEAGAKRIEALDGCDMNLFRHGASRTAASAGPGIVRCAAPFSASTGVCFSDTSMNFLKTFMVTTNSSANFPCSWSCHVLPRAANRA